MGPTPATIQAASQRGRVLFDHPGIFTRGRLSGFLNRF
jgi:hypothetical protein